MSNRTIFPTGPHALKWHQLSSKAVWLAAAVLLANFVWQSYRLATGEAAAGIIAVSLLAAIMFPAAWWYMDASSRLQRVLILRKNGETAEFHWEWWLKGPVQVLPPEFWHVYRSRRIPVINCLDEDNPAPLNVWGAPPGDVTSEDMARALEQGAARTIFESKSKTTAEIIKLGILGVFVAGGALLIVVLSAPPGAG